MIICAVGLILVGILCILGTFPLHNQELANRPAGHWVMADVTHVQELQGKTVGVVLDFWIKNERMQFSARVGEEGRYLKPGKQVPIIFNKQIGEIVLYPGKKSKKIQSALMALGMVLSLAGAFMSFFTI